MTDNLSLEDLYNFKGVTLSTGKGADALWISKIGDKESEKVAQSGKVDPLAYFVGKVERKIGDAASKLDVVDLTKHIDRRNGIVKSYTGEITWDFKNGVVSIDNPFVQGVCGFLGKKESIELSDISFIPGNEFGVIMAVSLDDKPLKESRKILIQTATKDRTYGFKTKDMGKGRVQITDTGTYPLIVQEIKASVVLKGCSSCKAEILCQAGYPRGDKAQTESGSAGVKVVLPGDSIYTVIYK
jgi:hypothetical protein